MTNVNNLNGVPNFGHGEEIPTESSLDEVETPLENEEQVKPHRAKVRSAARKALGGKY